MAEVLGAGSCRPRYVRFQPGRRLLVLYELDGEPAHLTVLKPGRTERLWERVRGSALARWVPEFGGVLQHFPLDDRLPGLAVAVRAGELVRYKPGRRAVMRYPGAYGKLRADEAGAAHVAVARELIARGIRTPAPLTYCADLGMALYEVAAGTPLATLRGGGLEVWMEPVAKAMAQLHAAEVPGLREHSMESELADLRAAAKTATALGVDALEPAERLAALLAAVEPRWATIHGSFHYDQVLVGDDGVTFVDLDSAARGHPLLDVGHFASYLSAAGEDAARARFLQAVDPDPEALLFEAAALLRWSSLPFRDLEPDWFAAVARRVLLARARLAEFSAARASR
jgi:aminoglycoside phosphotransferase (APT) family kinase protein